MPGRRATRRVLRQLLTSHMVRKPLPLSVEGDGVEIQVEGLAAGQAEPADGVEPAAHQLGIARRIDPAAILGEERSLGDDVQSGEEGQPLIQDGAHDMAVACRPEELQRQERAQGAAGRDHLRSGEPRGPEDAVQGDGGEGRQEEEQAAELGRERPGIQVELPHIGDLGRRRPRAGRSLVIGPARQASEPFILEDPGDGDRAERMPLVSQVAADVIDREVLFPQGDDDFSEGIGLGCGLRSLGRGQEEGAAGILAELMDQDAKAAGGIAEAAGDFGTGEVVHEEGAEGLVLAVGGVGGLEEDPREVR
jgi:hypothetical protein